MCGIFGASADSGIIKKNRCGLISAIDYLKHRGPDGMNYIEKDTAFMGHTRLSIIGLQHGKQPMTTADGRYTLSYNGEIYNYVQLRSELEKLGYKFTTNSDAEVLLYAFVEYRENCLEKLDGMFAFAIHDEKEDSLFLARDRFGIKPLFYSTYGNVFTFASEVNAIYKSGIVPFSSNTKHFNEFLIFGYVTGEETLHQHILELPPAHYLLKKDGKVRTFKYWNHYPEVREENLDEDIIIEELHNLLEERFLAWTIGEDISDIGVLLSGGLDSSLVAKVASYRGLKLNTVTAEFPNDSAYNEKFLTEILLKEINCNAKYVNIKDDFFAESYQRLTTFCDTPIHNTNSLTLMALCEQIRENTDIKVVLCGEGADELFGGYERYRTITGEYDEKQDINIINYAYNRVAIPRLKLLTDDPSINNPARGHIVDSLISRDSVNMLLELDQQTFLQSYLNRQDLVGMMYGLEIRTPFLDHKFAEYVNSLPGSFKVRDGTHKYILRKVAEKHIPKDIIWHKQKFQFNSPSSRMLYKGQFRDIYNELINPSCEMGKFYDVGGMQKLLAMHAPQKGTEHDHSNTLVRIISMELWLKHLKQFS